MPELDIRMEGKKAVISKTSIEKIKWWMLYGKRDFKIIKKRGDRTCNTDILMMKRENM